MRSLFFRFFFSFLVIMVIAGSISALVFSTMSRLSVESAREEFSRDFTGRIARFILVSGQAAHDTWLYSGTRGYRDYIGEFERGTGTRLAVTTSGDRDLAGDPLPATMTAMVEKARREKTVQVSSRDGAILVVGIIASGDKVPLIVTGMHRPGPPPVVLEKGPDMPVPPFLFGFLPPAGRLPTGLPGRPPEGLAAIVALGGGPVRLIALVVAATAVCILLARSFSAPLAKLRRATRQIAGGDLSVRVGNGLGHCAAEIIELGRDFDAMAASMEQAVALRRRLLQDISHELRSPLARLNVALELVEQRTADAGRSKALATIGKESERLNELIEQLLSLTRLEDGQEFKGSSRVDLSRLVREIVDDADFESRGTCRRVSLLVLGRISVVGSEELLRRAIENVVRNAARYTDEQTTVEVSLQRVDREALLTVKDYGPGVPAGELEAIFQPFYRVAAGRERRSGGTGLGLAIAAMTVKAHGGRIEAGNGIQGGLIVSMHLPAADVDEDQH